MTTKLQVWKQALIHLGKPSINSLTDDVEARYAFDEAWPGVLVEAFNAGDWNFAKKSVELEQSVTGTAAIGWSLIYDYPDDYTRSIAVSPYPGFHEPFTQYVDEGGFLSANTEPMYLRYISDEYQSDAGVEEWPDLFWRYVAVLLAYETVERLTQGTTAQDKLEARLEKALRKAKSVDARNEQGKRIAPGSWLRSRRNGGYGDGNSLGPTLVSDEIVLSEGDV